MTLPTKLLAEKIIRKKKTSFKNKIFKHSVILVRKCVQKKICENFKNYFKSQSHDRGPRNNNCLLQIPKKKLKYSKMVTSP